MKKSTYLILLLFSQACLATISDGNDLFLACRFIDNELSPPAQHCMEYIAAALEKYELSAKEENTRSCVPTGTSLSQLARIVLEYLEEYPDRLHYHGGELVIIALSESYPCPG